MAEESQNREQLASELENIKVLLDMSAWNGDDESFGLPAARFEIVHHGDGACDWKVTLHGNEVPHDQHKFANASEAKKDARDCLLKKEADLEYKLGTNKSDDPIR